VKHRDEIESILTQVSSWPEEERAALAYKILSSLGKQTRQAAPRDTAAGALGIAAGTTLPPDDLTVKQWIDEHRMQNYG
jgi:hypothetical protein